MRVQQHRHDAIEKDERKQPDRPGARRDLASRAAVSATPTPHPALPARYGLVVLGSGLVISASTVDVPLGPLANTAGRDVFSVVGGALGLALLIAACTRIPVPASWRARYHRLSGLVLASAFALAAGTLVVFAGAFYLLMHYPPAVTYTSDIISLAHAEAQLLLAGHNPYTSDWAFRDALARFPNAVATPIRGHVFGYAYTQPLPGRMVAVQREYVRSPASVPRAFDPRSLHSYPALSFLLYVPLLWAGMPDVLALHLVVYWALVAWLVWLAPVGWRHWGALVALAAMPTMAVTLQSNEIICVAFILVAWHHLDRRWVSSVVLGLACAYKQYCWFFLPFFAIEMVLRYGWREALRRASIAGGAFLAPNLPFLVASPGPWFQSLWLPMSAPLFASGMGFIALSIGGLLPYAPPTVYAAVEAAVMAAALWVYVRWLPQLREAALVLALLPVFFAFRSLPYYFGFAPWLALYAANRLYADKGAECVYSAPALAAGRILGWVKRRWRMNRLMPGGDEDD